MTPVLNPEVEPEFPGWVPEATRSTIRARFAALRFTLGRGTPSKPTASKNPDQVPRVDVGEKPYSRTRNADEVYAENQNKAVATMAAVVAKSADLTIQARNEVSAAVTRFNQAAREVMPRNDAAIPLATWQLKSEADLQIRMAKTAVDILLLSQGDPGLVPVPPASPPKKPPVQMVPNPSGGYPVAVPKPTPTEKKTPPPGQLVPNPDGGYPVAVKPSPAPTPQATPGMKPVDWSDKTTYGGAIVSATPGAAGIGLDQAARQFGADPAKMLGTSPAAKVIAKPLPIVGNVMGVVFGTASDAKDYGVGKALVTNAGGATLATVAGDVSVIVGTRILSAAIGQTLIPIPGVGTAVGLAVGTFLTPYATKFLQSLF